MRLVKILLAALIFTLTLAIPYRIPVVFAHQSGCHRWHSCPSDSGSYVCGDWGYSSYCGYGNQEDNLNTSSTYSYVPSYVCEWEGKKYYTHTEARSAWNAQIDAAVRNVYKILLERDVNQFDLDYWHAKFDYNYCNARGWSSKEIVDQVSQSDERKSLLAKKDEKAKAILGQMTASPNPTIHTTEESDDNFWIIIIVILVIATLLVDKSIKDYHNKH